MQHVAPMPNHKGITGWNTLTSILFVLEGILLVATLGAAIEYLRNLRKIKQEYKQAQGVVEDIVLSFSRQLERESEKLEITAYRVEANTSKIGKTSKAIAEIDGKMRALDYQGEDRSYVDSKIKANLEDITKALRNTIEKNEKLMARISDLEKRGASFAVHTDPKIETVIPIKRAKALAPLTKTELSVLEILVAEGPKTAPRIKDRIKLSREHTGRLMKKLYDEGYLERDTNRSPYRYWVKGEMKELLKKSQATT